MRTFDVDLQPSTMIQNKTYNRIPQKIKVEANDLRTCIQEVVLRVTRFIGNTIHFFQDFTKVTFVVQESYKILGTYYLCFKPMPRGGTMVSVCDVRGEYLPNFGFVVNLPASKPVREFAIV